MKKTLLSLVALISVTAFAQSLSIEPADYYYAETGEQCVAHFDITNTTDEALSVIVTRSYDPSYDIMSTFCWGTTCYSPTVNVSGVPILIEGQSSFDGFSGYINDMPENKTFIINYCFSVENDPSDKVCTDVEFTSSVAYVGVEETESVFGVYPNPANDILHLDCSAQQSADFVLYDMLGNKIYSELVLGNTTIQLNRFEAGIYFYSFSINGIKQEVQKLIITH